MNLPAPPTNYPKTLTSIILCRRRPDARAARRQEAITNSGSQRLPRPIVHAHQSCPTTLALPSAPIRTAPLGGWGSCVAAVGAAPSRRRSPRRPLPHRIRVRPAAHSRSPPPAPPRRVHHAASRTTAAPPSACLRRAGRSPPPPAMAAG